MRPLPLVILILFFSTFSVRADSTEGSLQITLPGGWDVKYHDEKGTEIYALTRSSSPLVVSMFSRSPSSDDLQQRSNMSFDFAVKESLKIFKNDPKVKLASENYTQGEFKGDPFSGKYAVFTMVDGHVATIFMFGNGDEIWNGEFTGPADQWIETLEMLKGIKKKG